MGHHGATTSLPPTPALIGARLRSFSFSPQERGEESGAREQKNPAALLT
jgi:hypothetical protein